MSYMIPVGQEARFCRALRVALITAEHISPIGNEKRSNEELLTYLTEGIARQDECLIKVATCINDNIIGGGCINFEWVERDNSRQVEFVITLLKYFFSSVRKKYCNNIKAESLQHIILANLDNIPIDTSWKITIGPYAKKLWNRTIIFERTFYKWLKDSRTGSKDSKFQYTVRFINRYYPKYQTMEYKSIDEEIKKFVNAIYKIHLTTEDLFGDIKSSYSNTKKRKTSTEKEPQLNIQVSHATKLELKNFIKRKKGTIYEETQSEFVERAILQLIHDEHLTLEKTSFLNKNPVIYED